MVIRNNVGLFFNINFYVYINMNVFLQYILDFNYFVHCSRKKLATQLFRSCTTRKTTIRI